jgi:hypothetical protein
MKFNKIFAAAILSLSGLSAFAQTAVTPPTAPTVPNTVTVSPNATTALGNSTTNRIFIDQSGSNPDVNMTQDGSGNKQGSAQRPIYLRGADQVIITRQIGNNNEIDLEVSNPTTGASVGAKVTIQQIGNSNKVDAACGYGNSSTGTALTGCKNADLNWKFTGNSNEFQFRASGDDIRSAVTVAGNGNKFWIDAVGNKHSQTLMVTGDNNEFNLSQTSTGSAGSSIWIDQTGTGTKFFVAQSGTVDNVLNIKSVATGGTFNIVQKN